VKQRGSCGYFADADDQRGQVERVPSHSRSRHSYASCRPTSAMSLSVINIDVRYELEKGPQTWLYNFICAHELS